MSEYKIYTLGSKATGYIRETMETCGLSLAKHVLKHLDLKAGQVTTALPSEGYLENIEDFDGGGIIPQPPKSEWKKCNDGSVFVPLLHFDSYAIDIIHTFMDSGSAQACVFEDLTSRPTDAWVEQQKPYFRAYGDEVYWLLVGRGHTNEKIRHTISFAETTIPVTGVLTSLPDEDCNFLSNSKLTSEIIETLAEKDILFGKEHLRNKPTSY
ncbi:MAG: hypothetical protein HN929_07165 [Chloroflexi bacterium]|jgi:hypothetical protein|nr:hypothetical protein [Chloroflexota bacterium]MBT7081227.1 hypothetical protein [Chloroflexota bacterium]